jgi:iron complex outermembrane receptor protein
MSDNKRGVLARGNFVVLKPWLSSLLRVSAKATALAVPVVALISFPAYGADEQVAAASTASTKDQPVTFAQGAQTTPARSPAASDDLGEIVVTAERRSSSQQTTPISITAVSGDQLADKHIDGLATLQTTAPNLTFNASGFTQFVNIRGIGVGSNAAAIVPGVAVMYDGLFQAETIGLNVPFYDIADTEVLRGPQGTFVGQSSTGGAVLITSQNPNFDGVNGYVEAQVGTYNDRKVQGAVNLPINDILAMRIAFNTERRNSFYSLIGSDSETIPGTTGTPNSDPGHLDNENIRVGVLFKPTDEFQALLKVELNNYSSGGLTGVADQNTPHQYSPFYGYTTHEPFVLNFNEPDLANNNTVDRYSLELKYTLPDGILLRSLSGFQHLNVVFNLDLDGSSADALVQRQDTGPKDNYYSQEFNVISPSDGPLTWIGGASFFYRYTPSAVVQLNSAPPFSPANPEVIDSDVSGVPFASTVRSVGLFGQVTYQVLDTLQAELGIRDNYDNFFNTGFITVTVPSPPGPPGGAVIQVPNGGKYQDNVPTAKVGLNYTPVPGQFFYLFAARGYKSGGVNGGTENFLPEHVNDYEAGWKGKLVDDHLQIQLGGFLMNYFNQQQQLISPVTGTNDVSNLGSSKIQGIELSVQARLGQFDADFSAAYTDSKLGAVTAIQTYKLPNQGATNLGPQCPIGVEAPTCFNYAPYETSLSGEANPYSPKLTYNADIGYGIGIGKGIVRPRLNFSHTDKQYASIFQTDNFYLMGPRNLLGATLNYEQGPWLAQFYGINLTNEVYTSGLNASGNLQYYGDPRQAGFRFRRTF